jgi:hypothetical protein
MTEMLSNKIVRGERGEREGEYEMKEKKLR